MARPKKCRVVCHYPQTLAFDPRGAERQEEAITMTVDEFETIRLIDAEGLSQEQCSDQMGIARTTVQQIYANARQKLAKMLVESRPLQICGGDYQLCSGENAGCAACFRRQFEKLKGENTMRIAVTYENGMIFQHFGHTAFFKVYDIQDGKVIASEVVSTNGSGHGALAGVLNALNADVLICGGIGGGAQAALAEAGIRLYGGVSGSADAAVEALLEGKLLFNPNVMCNHHGEHHHGEGHTCGSHGCGSDHHCH